MKKILVLLLVFSMLISLPSCYKKAVKDKFQNQIDDVEYVTDEAGDGFADLILSSEFLSILFCDSEGFLVINGVLYSYIGEELDITIPSKVKEIAPYAFSGRSDLTSVTIPYGVKKIGNRAFNGCNNLTSITIPSSVEEVFTNMFLGCNELFEYENGVKYIDKWAVGCDTSVTVATLRSNTVGIGAQAFSDCTSLNMISIPLFVKYIGENAFENCSSLKDVCYSGTKKLWNSTEKGDNWNGLSSGVSDLSVICSDGTITY